MANPALVAFPSTTFSAATSFNINSSASTQIGDLLVLVTYGSAGAGNPTPFDSRWIAIVGFGNDGALNGYLSAYRRLATVNGSESIAVDIALSSGCAAVATIRGVNQRGQLDNFSWMDGTPHVTWQIPSISTLDDNDGVLIVAVAEDTTSETWGLAPSLTQQMFSFNAAAGQIVGWYTTQATAGAITQYAATKTGSAGAGAILGIYFFVGPFVINSVPFGSATVGTPYSSSFGATGGQTPYVYSAVGLPPGLSVNSSTGAITGTPTASGYWSVKLIATDANGATAIYFASIIIPTVGPPPPVGSPVAAHTFSFEKVYVSTRIPGPPGSGWTNPIKIIDDNGGAGFDCETFSSGALTGDLSEPRGIVGKDGIDGLIFFGDGIPNTGNTITFPGIATPLTPQDYWDTSQGAWSHGGALYLLVFQTGGGGLIMLKSTDGGVSWAKQDQANAEPGVPQTAVQRIDTKILIFTQMSDRSGWLLKEFDLTTDTWGPTFGFSTLAVDDVSENNEFSNSVFKFPNGDYAIVYDHDSSGSGRGVVFQLFSSGAWGPEIYIKGVGNSLGNTLMDPDLTTIHVFCLGSTGTPSSPATYSRVTHAGTVTADIFTWPAQPNGGDGFGHPSIQNGLLFAPYDNFDDGTNAVWVSTLPAVTFVKEFLPLPSGEGGSIQTPIVIVSGGNSFAVNDTGFVATGNGDAEYKIDSVSAGVVTGLHFLNVGSQYLPAMGVATTTGGAQPGVGTGLTVTIQQVELATPSCAYMMFPNGYSVGPSTPTLACPIGSTATVGVPYTGMLLASGGTPPYAFAIIA